MPGVGCGTPILGMDVWEHAYICITKTEDLIILKLFNVINWTEVSRRFVLKIISKIS
jgi:Fe-Mn family superoxide dismutase